MKTITYTKEVEMPKLSISPEVDFINPRHDDDTLGYFITCDTSYESPDSHEELESIIKETGEQAPNVEVHMTMIRGLYDGNIVAIYPVSKYEHSGIKYSRGTAHGFDNSNNGFYVVTDKTQKVVDVKKKDFEEVIDSEIDIYNKYVNGEVYRFTLFDEDGEVEDACGGFYDLEAIQQNLPKEWAKENMEDYLTND